MLAVTIVLTVFVFFFFLPAKEVGPMGSHLHTQETGPLAHVEKEHLKD